MNFVSGVLNKFYEKWQKSKYSSQKDAVKMFGAYQQFT